MPLLRSQPRMIALALGATLPWMFHAPAWAEPGANALPSGGQVTAGTASLTYTANKLQIDQASPNAVINWDAFSVGRDAWVNFSQPNSSAIALNRVLGSNPSEIYGRVSANGGFWITNPNGILFAPSAAVDVGALFATTLAIADRDFLAGRYSFYDAGGARSVVNKGSIVTANGYAALAGPQVRNEGIIIARSGTIALAAGDRVSLDMVGDGLINVSVEQAALDATAINSGRLEADGGRVMLTARSANALLDTVVNNTGAVRANSLVERNGDIVLDGGSVGVVSNAGTLSAAGIESGVTGGTVRVLGEKVALLDGTRIDASGQAGGGTVLIGGNFHGQGAEANARRTYIAKDATISADAVIRGDGGRVVVWSDEATAFYGRISAKGGADFGNGGFSEVSSKGLLAFAGSVDLTACRGSVGSLVLDPTDIVVGNTTATGNDGANAGRILFGDAAGVEPWDVTPAALDAVGASVILQAINNITFVDPVALNSAGAGLTAQAGKNISVLPTSSITTNNGAIRLEADSLHSSAGGANGSGSLAISAPLNSGGAPITLTGASFVIGANVNAGAGGINLARSQTNVTFTIGTGGQLAQADINNLLTSGGLVLGTATSAGSDGAGSGMQTLTARSLIVNTPLAIAAASGSSVSVRANNGVTVNANVTSNQPTTINADADGSGVGTLTVAATKSVSTSGNSLGIVAADIDLQGTLNSGGADTTITASNSRSIGVGTAAGNLTLDNLELGQITSSRLTLQTGGDISANGVTGAATTRTGLVALRPGAAGTVTIGNGTSDSSIFTGGLIVAGGIRTNIAGTIAAAGNGVIDLGATPVTVTDTASVGGTSIGAVTLGPVTIAAGEGLNIGAGAATPISLGSVGGTTANGESLTINTAGAVTVSDAVGSAAVPLGSVKVTNSAGTTFQGAVVAQSAILSNTTGTIAFQGNTTLATLNTAAQSYSVAMTGSANHVSNAVTFSNTGAVILGDGGDTSTFANGVTHTLGATSINGTLTAIAGDVILGATTLIGTVNAISGGITTGALAANGGGDTLNGGTINTGAITIADGNTLWLNGTTLSTGPISGIAGAAASNVTFNASGTVTVSGALGNDIGTLTVANSAGTTFQSAVNAQSAILDNTTGTIAFQGDTTLATLSTAARPYSVAITGSANHVSNPVTFSNSGALVIGDGPTDASAFDGGVVATAPASKFLGGTISSANASMNFAQSLTILNADTTISTGTGAVTFGAVDGAFNLVINSSGVTTFDAAVGGVSALRSLTTDAPGITAINGGSVRTTGAQTYSDSVTGNNVTLASINSGAITAANTANDFSGTLNLSGGATQVADRNSLTLGNLMTGDLLINASGALDLGGGNIAGSLTASSNGFAITQSAPLVVTGATNLSALNTNGAAIMTSTITLDRDNDFMGAVSAAASAVTLTDLNTLTPGTISAGSGIVTLSASSLSASGSLQGGSALLRSANPVGDRTDSLNINFGRGSVVLTGTASAWYLSGPAVPQPAFTPNRQNTGANVFYNNGCISGPACAGVFAVTASIGASVTQIAAQALKDAQSRDSVAKQIDYGFAGDVGTTPPMDHRIDETGISTPECFDESREGQPCKVD
ncbi:MAG: beta strand repeat-containing protein [Burkholderiales bacterium]